jgi:predicted AlkP superfamily pyrophosphatase or phosphodiesterase
MRLCFFLTLLVGLVGCTGPVAPKTTPTVSRVLIVSVDGLRPDMALLATAPNMRALCRSGSYTFWAKTLDWPVTLPSHTSMLTGVLPAKHGVWTNSDWGYIEIPKPQVPTIFERAKSAGLSTALVSGKPKFEALAQVGSLDWWYVPELRVSVKDSDVAERATEILRLHRPQVMFVHLPGVDAAGHRDGWGSAAQLQAVQTADKALGRILAEMRRQKLLDQTAILLTADHGGTGQSHWRNDDRNTHIPWILSGPGIKKNVDLSQYRDLTVHTCDTFATVCYLLKLPLADDLDGKPVLKALEQDEPEYDPSY